MRNLTETLSGGGGQNKVVIGETFGSPCTLDSSLYINCTFTGGETSYSLSASEVTFINCNFEPSSNKANGNNCCSIQTIQYNAVINFYGCDLSAYTDGTPTYLISAIGPANEGNAGTYRFTDCKICMPLIGLETPKSNINGYFTNCILTRSTMYNDRSCAANISNCILPPTRLQRGEYTLYGNIDNCVYNYGSSSVSAGVPSTIAVCGMMTNCRFNGPAIGTYPQVQDGGVILNCYDGGGKAINIFS